APRWLRKKRASPGWSNIISPLEREMAGRQRGSLRVKRRRLPRQQMKSALYVRRPPSVVFGDISPSRGETIPAQQKSRRVAQAAF
ncbi:hypothetical protein, partial [Mesorhizobium sp. M00.F.Ca.ET.217.01.1.1]|uniref:hypothetical protein n=1 Tax=Mesorhizobium sp. M00.F.Ca.ET.217.01.1.1 TaxID=2500529 RepID=UPI001AEDAC99